MITVLFILAFALAIAMIALTCWVGLISQILSSNRKTLDAHQRDLDAKGRTLGVHQEHLEQLRDEIIGPMPPRRTP